MYRRPSKRVTAVVAAAAFLLCVPWLSSSLLPAWFANGRAGGSLPRVVLSCRQRDLGAVRQGDVLRATFPVANAGTRRLILVERAGACCGQSAEPREVIVAPGEGTELTVEIDTARWHGRLEQATHYATNDPRLPRFALAVTALVESPPP